MHSPEDSHDDVRKGSVLTKTEDLLGASA